MPFWLKPGKVVVTLGAGKERREERIPEQLRRFLWRGQGISVEVESRNPDQSMAFLSGVFCGIKTIGKVYLPVRQRRAEKVLPPYANRERSDLLAKANPFPAKLNWP